MWESKNKSHLTHLLILNITTDDAFSCNILVILLKNSERKIASGTTKHQLDSSGMKQKVTAQGLALNKEVGVLMRTQKRYI